MNKFILDCEAVESIKTEINTLIGEVDETVGSVTGYDLTATDFNFEEARNSILSNLNYMKEKITNTVALFDQVTNTHTDLQNSLKIEYVEEGNAKKIDVNSLSSDNGFSSSANGSISEYTIKKGDTLNAIAAATGVSVKELQEANNIKNANLIYTGEKIKIPNKTNNQTTTQNTSSLNTDKTSNEHSGTSNTKTESQNYKSNQATGFAVTTGNKTYKLNETDYDFLCAVVSAESDRTADDALGVASVILNRCDSKKWSSEFGPNVRDQLVPSQFSVLVDKRYLQYLNGKSPATVKTAVSDALNGIRNNEYLSFNGNAVTNYSTNMITSSGNRYK